MRAIYLLLAVLVACGSCSQAQPTEMVAPTTFTEPQQKVLKVHEPISDNSFATEEKIQAWRDELNGYIVDEASPKPEKILALAMSYQVSMKLVDELSSPSSYWGAAYVEPPYSTLESDTETPPAYEAVALEADDREWEAAQIYLAHDRPIDAERCARALAKEGEWKVVAMIAIETGNLDLLSEATDALMADRMVTKTYEVARYAAQQGKSKAAMHVIRHHNFVPSHVLSEQQLTEIAIDGDRALLVEIIADQLRVWKGFDGFDHYSLPVSIMANIAILGRSDPDQARGFARSYLEMDHANTFIMVYDGEGIFFRPMRGTIELFQLISNDLQLRELYFARLTKFLDEAVNYNPLTTPEVSLQLGTDPDSFNQIAGDHYVYDDWQNWIDDSGDPVTLMPRQINLLFTYLKAVQQSGDETLRAFWLRQLQSFPAFEREIGRAILRQTMNAQAEDLSLVECYALSRIVGQTPPDLTPETMLLPGLNYYRDSDLYWLIGFLEKGELTQQNKVLIWGELGVVDDEERDFSLQKWFERGFDDHYGDDYRLEKLLMLPAVAVSTNKAARQQRAALSLKPITLYPSTTVQAAELLAPSIEVLKEHFPFRHSDLMERYPGLLRNPPSFE